MRKNPSYTALLRPTRLLISEKSATYTIKWSYTIIWQVRVRIMNMRGPDMKKECHFGIDLNPLFERVGPKRSLCRFLL